MQTVASRLVRGVVRKNAISTFAARASPVSSTIKPENVVSNPYAGEYLHQRGRVYQVPCKENGKKIVVNESLRKELIPLFTLAGVVVMTVGFAVYTMWWENLVHPNVNFASRGALHELEEEELTKEKAAVYLQSPVRKASLSPIANIQHEPPPKIGRPESAAGSESRLRK